MIGPYFTYSNKASSLPFIKVTCSGIFFDANSVQAMT